jgi:thiol-disulfide isomerase/thioredoxin
MKKLLLSLFVMCMVVFPMVTYASEFEKVNLEDYNTTNLIETLQSEQIEVKLKDYKETDDQVTIYLFRGTGCGYCKAFLTFLNNLPAEYYNKIKAKN